MSIPETYQSHPVCWLVCHVHKRNPKHFSPHALSFIFMNFRKGFLQEVEKYIYQVNTAQSGLQGNS